MRGRQGVAMACWQHMHKPSIITEIEIKIETIVSGMARYASMHAWCMYVLCPNQNKSRFASLLLCCCCGHPSRSLVQLARPDERQVQHQRHTGG